MADANRVQTLYKGVQEKMNLARPAAVTGVFKHVLQSLEETLASMKPMVLEIDQSNKEIIRLLKKLGRSLSDFRSKAHGVKPEYLAELEQINEKLNRFLRGYVDQILKNIGREVQNVEDPERLLDELINNIQRDQHGDVAEPTKLAYEMLDLTLVALDKQLTSGELVYTNGLLSLLKIVQVHLRFPRVQYMKGIPEYLKTLGQGMRKLLPDDVRQPLDSQIQELQTNYDQEQKKIQEEQLKWMLWAIGLALLAIVFSYLKKWKAELLTFVLFIIIVIMAFAWYLYQWRKPKVPEPSYHVFLSCRGDILKTHAEPLNRALRKLGLRTFYYGVYKTPGQKIKKKLERGIDRSMSAIIIFSKEFATSEWCLDEVVWILDRNKQYGYPFIHIYCDGVKHTDLKLEENITKSTDEEALENHKKRHGEENITKSIDEEALENHKKRHGEENITKSIYEEALENHKKRHGEEKVNKWKQALKEVSDYEVPPAPGSESELNTFFAKVAEKIKEELARMRH